MTINIQCEDRVGLVAAISGLIAQESINIISMREHVDTEQHLFFARLEMDDNENAQLLKNKLKEVLPQNATINIHTSQEKKVVVMVTKEYHCLGDILIKNHFKTLGATVQCVIGNHAVLEEVCTKFNIPFHFISHTEKDKPSFEKEIIDTLKQYDFDYLVLAKFMRILSSDFISQYKYKVINIHHSFLPAFIGANPYRQAFDRGVKLIGATAHFVTDHLDEGPIIAQNINPVNHTFSVADMMRAGKEIEKTTLSRALQLVFEDRVFVYNNKTVIFE